MSYDTLHTPPQPINEPVLSYAPGSPERQQIQETLSSWGPARELPCWIHGEQVLTQRCVERRNPSDHQHLLGRVHLARPEDIEAALDSGRRASADWAAMPWDQRAAIFLKAAELIAGPWRARLNASTMLGQGKTVHQAEIDAACELIDFLRFNVHYASQIYAEQPQSSPGVWNWLDHRPLEGFVFAITPFNFTAIAGNLPCSAALMGNTVIWKPAPSSALSNHLIMEILTEAGLPPGVINLLHGEGADVGDALLPHPELAGVHFTGSTGVFQTIWATVGSNIQSYRSYPRIVGETGGKDFILAHPSADPKALTVALLRGAFEFQGQKCSAASRAFLPKSLWELILPDLLSELAQMKMGDVRDMSHFIGPVIDRRSFEKISSYLELAHRDAEVLAGGHGDDRQGWFIEPTIVRVPAPDHRLMREEIFGPVLSIFVYEDEEFESALRWVDEGSPYALTGSIFSRDRGIILKALKELRQSAGNFYINDKPTGAVVGQQPFGGGRASGTNDKAGSALNLLRWLSPRTVKETFCPPHDWRYPFLEEDA